MEVIEVWREPKSFGGALDVLGDVCAGVGDTTVGKDIKAALGCDCK